MRSPCVRLRLVRLVLALQLLLPSRQAALLLHPAQALAAPAAATNGPPRPASPPASRQDNPDFLALTWASKEAHAGVPVTLGVQATAGDHRTKLATSGVVQLVLPDDRAQMAGLLGTPATGGQRFGVPLEKGTATLAVTFETPGQFAALATLDGSAPRMAGHSAILWVHDTFLAIEGPVAVADGPARSGSPAAQPLRPRVMPTPPDLRQRFTIVARDETGKPVDGYIGDLVVTTSDTGALVSNTGESMAWVSISWIAALFGRLACIMSLA